MKNNLPESINSIYDAMVYATAILENKNSNFQRTRTFIRSTFDYPNEKLTFLENIKIRLLLIDTTYSTQMGRRLYGIDELAEKIKEVSKKGCDNIKNYTDYDKNFVKKLDDYIKYVTCPEKQSDNNPINALFKAKYGMRKDGQDEAAAARSLISKYSYYVSKYNFPIEDSLVRNNTNNILKYFEIKKTNNDEPLQLKEKSTNLVKELIIICTELKKVLNIKNKNIFDEFDHLVWSYGKIKKGSLSVFVSKENYEKITKFLEIESLLTERKRELKEKNPKASIPNDLADTIIKKEIQEPNKLEHMLSENWVSANLVKFINFCFKCEQITDNSK